MHFQEYQKLSRETDQLDSRSSEDAVMVALLGLAGETGELLSEYKKYLRGGDAYQLFDERLTEELGDVLWYLSSVATRFGLSLEDVAQANLSKTRERWLESSQSPGRFDADFPSNERLPDEFVVEVHRVAAEAPRVRLTIDGEPVGDELTDNAPEADSYRFHDVFHFAFAAVLGWSPVVRALLQRKRKSDSAADEVEDGGRAIAIEEGVIAYIFPHAQAHSFYADQGSIDYSILRTVKRMTSTLEVGARTTKEWEEAILQGFSVWRALHEHEVGRVVVNLVDRQISFMEISDAT